MNKPEQVAGLVRVLHHDDDQWKPWQDSLFRMARKAAADPAFYEIAGGTVQHYADEILAARPALTDTARFIVDYIAAHGDEHGEVHGRAVINYALSIGSPTERELVKTRHKHRDRIGTRKATRCYGDHGRGWVWYAIPADGLLEDSTPATSGSGMFQKAPGWSAA